MIFNVGDVFWSVPSDFTACFTPDRCLVLERHDSSDDDQASGVTVLREGLRVQVASRLLYPSRLSAAESARKQAEARRALAREAHQDAMRRLRGVVLMLQRRSWRLGERLKDA